MKPNIPDFRRLLSSEMIFTAMAAIIGFLGLIDSSGFNIQLFQNGVWLNSALQLNNLLYPLLIIVFIQVIFIYTTKYKNYLVFPVLYLLLLRNFDLMLNLSIICLYLVIINLINVEELLPFYFWLLFFSVIFLTICFIHWAILLPLGLSGGKEIAFIEQGIFYLFASISPYLYCVLAVIGVLFIRRRTFYAAEDRQPDISRKNMVIMLLLLSLLTLYTSIYPYMASVNPDSVEIGVDYLSMVDGLSSIQAESLKVFTVVDGQRPFFFISLLIMQRVTGFTVEQTIRYFPIPLNLILLFSAFIFTREFTGSNKQAVLSSFLISIGFPIVAGLYSGVYANNYALSLTLLSLGLFLRYLKYNRVLDFASFSLCACLSLFTHPWTFYLYHSPLVLLTIYSVSQKSLEDLGLDKQNMISYLFVIAIVVLLKMITPFLFGSVGVIPVITRLTSLSSIWYDIQYGSLFIYGGSFGNLFPGILSLIYLYSPQDFGFSRKYLSWFMFFTSIAWMVGDQDIKSRLILNAPLWFFSAQGLILIEKSLKIREPTILFYVFILFSQLVYCYRSIANFF